MAGCASLDHSLKEVFYKTSFTNTLANTLALELENNDFNYWLLGFIFLLYLTFYYIDIFTFRIKKDTRIIIIARQLYDFLETYLFAELCITLLHLSLDIYIQQKTVVILSSSLLYCVSSSDIVFIQSRFSSA